MEAYTHNFAGQRLLEAIDFTHSTITIDGQSHPIDRRVANAIQACPACFYAGTVGPDGFPDIVYGQGVIHPNRSGEWMRHLFVAAWNAQAAGSPYSTWEQKKILAFAYGYLMHAAGDLWGHTIINELSGDVFPESWLGMLWQPSQLGIAMKHLAVEGVIGDATPGFDGERDTRKTAPGGYGQTAGDVSDDATPGYAYDVPVQFIHDALIALDAGTPVRPVRGQYNKSRGYLLGFFLEMRAELKDFLGTGYVNPLSVAINSYDETLAALRSIKSDCDFDCTWYDPSDCIHDLWACPAALLELGWDFAVDSAEAFARAAAAIAWDLEYAVLEAYVSAWIDDIDSGLEQWAELGLATSQGLFDAQTRRNIQNEECAWVGSESTDARATCESNIGIFTAMIDNSESFIDGHLLSMIGFPDFVGDVDRIVGQLGDMFKDLLADLDLPLDPLVEPVQGLQEWCKELIKDCVTDVAGIPVDQFEDVLKYPTHTMCQSSVLWSPIGGVFGEPTWIPLFQNNEHERLDDYLGFSGTVHHVGDECSRLTDSTVIDEQAFAPYRNTVQMSKLIMLDPAEMDALLTALMGRTIGTYTADAQDPHPRHAFPNIMFTSIDETYSSAQDPGSTYLRLIDGDHAWRKDGLPVFATHVLDSEGSQRTGGSGHFPIWASCVLRHGNALQSLFRDWENPWQASPPHGPSLEQATLDQFPPLSDAPLPDDTNDPYPPQSSLTSGGTTYTTGSGSLYVAGNNSFMLSATDGPPGRSFAQSDLTLRARAYTDPANPGPFVAASQGEVFNLTVPDGTYYLDYQSSDPCHTFETDPLPVGTPESVHTLVATLDTAPPAVTYATPPFGGSYTSAGTVTLSWQVSDGTGSGVASVTAGIDGVFGATGLTTVTDGTAIDLFTLAPGTRTVYVSAADHLTNHKTWQGSFEVHATTQSLLTNLQAAYTAGLIWNKGVYISLTRILDTAMFAFTEGKNPGTALRIMFAFEQEVKAQSGRGLDAGIAARLVAYAQDFITSGGNSGSSSTVALASPAR